MKVHVVDPAHADAVVPGTVGLVEQHRTIRFGNGRFLHVIVETEVVTRRHLEAERFTDSILAVCRLDRYVGAVGG